jgi:hypothetical protein
VSAVAPAPAGLALTDDEVVALAVRSGTPWPAAVPTVNRLSKAAVETAVNRGVRSLMARQLLGVGGADETAEILGALVRQVSVGNARLGAYFGDSRFAYCPSTLAWAYYAGPGGAWLTETVTPLGIHYLVPGFPGVALEEVRALVAEVYIHGVRGMGVATADADRVDGPATAGTDAPRLPEYLCLVGAPSQQPVPMVGVCQQKVLVLRTGAPSEPPQAGPALPSPEAAIDFVLEGTTT